MKKYRYLAELAHSDAWINGGEIPLFPASTYRAADRLGIFTPDENVQSTFNVDIKEFGFETDTIEVKNMLVIGGGRPVQSIEGKRWLENGIILCLSSAPPHWDTMADMGKQCCVEVQDVFALKELLDAQIGSESEMGDCEYTWGPERSHFLKSADDRWQTEYRLFWKDQPGRKVVLPPSVAKPVRLWKGMWHSGTFFRP